MLRALSAYTRAYVRYDLPQSMTLSEIAQDALISALLTAEEQGLKDEGPDAVAVTGEILKTKTKRLKQRLRRATKHQAQGSSAQRQWPEQLQQVATAGFQQWDTDVFMWVAHLACTEALNKYQFHFKGDIPDSHQVQHILSQCGDSIIAA